MFYILRRDHGIVPAAARAINVSTSHGPQVPGS